MYLNFNKIYFIESLNLKLDEDDCSVSVQFLTLIPRSSTLILIRLKNFFENYPKLRKIV